jgi:periplasmic divalent cation tolerance protein
MDVEEGSLDSSRENSEPEIWSGFVHWMLENEMHESNSRACIVLTTESTLDEANKLGRTLVEERLVACVTLLPAVQSIYHWEGQIQSAPETMVVLKTSADKLEALEARVHQLHSYHVPEFLVLPVEHGSKTYLEWLFGALQAK